MSQKIETIFKYNGNEYEFDVRDADCSELFETAVSKMAEHEKGIVKTGLGSNIIREQCKMIKNFFDDCLGEGAGIGVCSQKDNIAVCYAAYDAFLSFVKAQKEDVISAKNTFAKYTNRQQRRAAANNKTSKPKAKK